MNHFADSLIAAMQKKRSPLCVGIDPHFHLIPEFLKERFKKQYGPTRAAAAACTREFSLRIIEAVAEHTAVIKPQSAFFEQLGYEGIHALEDVIRHAHGHELLVLLDAKRGDIGSTAAAYSTAAIGTADLFGERVPVLNADAVTVNPYLGTDSIQPFLETCAHNGKGIFIIAKTSNPSSGELQDRKLKEGIPLYEAVAKQAEAWGSNLRGSCGYSSVGIVAGATYPHQLSRLREILPHTLFLVPGIGAQGGRIRDILPAFAKDGLGALLACSRSIIFAWKNSGNEREFASAANKAAKKLKNTVNSHIKQ